MREDINILIAEDNDVTRELMSGILQTRGYKIFGAIDGTAAIDIIQNQQIDLALVDLNMEPKGGFDFARHLSSRGIKLPVILVTSDNSSDLLTAANNLGIKQVLHKPVIPERLIQSVERILYQLGLIDKPGTPPKPQAASYSPEQLMQRAIDLADRNARIDNGGPFAAVIANKSGQVIGEGINDPNGRIDPMAHAEVMAIRNATQKLNTAHLNDCVLYCSSEPTMVAKAVILSVGIPKVLFGLSHADITRLKPQATNEQPSYEQYGRDAALKMFERWKKHDRK